MSSSDEPLDFTVFAPRAVSARPEILSPASELAAVLQRYRADLDAMQVEQEQAQRQGLLALADQAVLAFQLAAALSRYEPDLQAAGLARVHRHLRVLKDQLLDALRGAGLEIVDPAGRPFDEVADLVQIDGWRHRPEYAAEAVAEVLEPIILSRGALIRPGRVVMGAPPPPPEEGGT